MREKNPNLWVSPWVYGTAPRPSLPWGPERGKESKVQGKQSSWFCCFYCVFMAQLGSDLQCVQGLSTPPRLPLYIHYVWLQLHYLLLQFAHLSLGTHMWVLVFLKHQWHTQTHMQKHTQLLPDHSWQQFAPSPSTHRGVSLTLENVKSLSLVTGKLDWAFSHRNSEKLWIIHI